MKRLPLLLLALMALLFLLSGERNEEWAGWVQAFAEAGMVGALADWFAVVALFRHPLGIPIPHTAIVPRRKDEIGDNLARFVAEHFLHPDAVRAKLATVNLAKTTAQWLKSPHGHARVMEVGLRLAGWALGALHEERVRQFVRRLSRRQLRRIDVAPLFGRTLDWLVEDGRHQQILTQALRFAVVLLHENREVIRGNVQQESPWWVPGFVDDRILVQMLDRIETLLMQISLDPEHPMREDFSLWVETWARDLRRSPEQRRRGETFKRNLLENEALQDYLYTLWRDVVLGLEKELGDPQSGLRQQLDSLLRELADEMERDADVQAWLNHWLTESAALLVQENRHAIASLISDTVRSWDAEETGQRAELAIGRDLQFIRINGTLVGGIVGLAIHAFQLL